MKKPSKCQRNSPLTINSQTNENLTKPWAIQKEKVNIGLLWNYT